MNKELSDEIISYLIVEQCSNDHEMAHFNADDILCELLDRIGYTDVVENFRKIRKWYS